MARSDRLVTWRLPGKPMLFALCLMTLSGETEKKIGHACHGRHTAWTVALHQNVNRGWSFENSSQLFSFFSLPLMRGANQQAHKPALS